MPKLQLAQQAIAQAIAKAEELGIAISVSVVDEAGNVVASAKMDNALRISPKFAFSKAHTSALIGLPTSGIAGYASPGQPYYGITTAFGGELMTIAGGIPIMDNGQLVGGIGVGGSTDVTQDEICAQAAAQVYAPKSQ